VRGAVRDADSLDASTKAGGREEEFCRSVRRTKFGEVIDGESLGDLSIEVSKEGHKSNARKHSTHEDRTVFRTRVESHGGITEIRVYGLDDSNG